MEEKFGVVLEAVTSKFKAKMEEVKALAKNTSDRIKQSLGSQQIDVKMPKMSTVETEVRVEQLKREISALKHEMLSVKPNTNLFREYAKAVNEAEQELKELNVQQKEVNRTSTGFGKAFKGIEQVDKGLKGMIHRVGRYTLAILSIRTAFSLVSKASQAYLQYDTDLANKLQGVWAALGAFLAPIIEKIANILMKLVGYLNVFIKAVTGQDLLAKASAKATAKIKDQTKATKALNKSLTDMDEITNIMDETGAGGGAGEIDNPFKNFKEPDLKWADKIKKFGEWIKSNWAYVLGAFAGLSSILEGLKITLAGGAFAKFGKILIGVGLIILGFVGYLKSVKDYIKLVTKGLEDSKQGWKKWGNMIASIGVIVAGVGVLLGNIPIALIGVGIALLGILASYWEDIKRFLGKAKDWLIEKFKWLFGDTIGDIMVDPIIQAINAIENLLDGLFRGLKGIFTGFIQFVHGDFKKGMASALRGVGNLLIGVLNGLIDGANMIMSPLRSLIAVIASVGGKKVSMQNIKIPRIAYLDSGTGYVPEDQMAYIHKGEAVIPKKFNSAEYFSNINDNTETNNLLLDVNRTLIDILEKDNSFYVNGKELARTTYNDFQEEGSRINKNNIVKVG